MKTFLLRIALCCGLFFCSLVRNTEIAHAAACASPAANQINCRIDQQMIQNGGGDGFGASVRLGQTVKPSSTKRLCRVDLNIQKNVSYARSLTLKISGPGLASPSFVTIQAPAIPLKTPTWIIFNFGCAVGPLLQAGASYFLELSASDSVANAYTWINSQGAGGNAAYPHGSGWRNAGAGWMQQNYDYDFKVHLCY